MKTSKSSNTQIYLNIANFNIELRFQPTDFKLSIRYLKSIKQYFQGFIVEKPKIIHSVLEIGFNFSNYQNLTKKQDTYMFIYKKTAPSHYLTHYGTSFFQFQLIIKDILAQLLQKKGLLIHGSACIVDNQAQLFLGPSGAGKTTVVRLLRNNFLPIADDSLILKREGHQYWVYQTPFKEKVSWIRKTNRVWKLGNIFWLKKSPTLNSKNLMTNTKKKIRLITKQIWIDRIDQNTFSTILSLCKNNQHFYKLQFTKNQKKLNKLITD